MNTKKGLNSLHFLKRLCNFAGIMMENLTGEAHRPGRIEVVCGSMFSGLMNGILGTSYTSEDSDLVATENNYAAKENELQQQIDNIESTPPGYDEYR